MAHVKKLETRKAVNLSPVVGAMLEDRLSRINKARHIAGKSKLNRNDIIELAIQNLDIRAGVEK